MMYETFREMKDSPGKIIEVFREFVFYPVNGDIWEYVNSCSDSVLEMILWRLRASNGC